MNRWPALGAALLAAVPLAASGQVVREQVVSGGAKMTSVNLPAIAGGASQTYVLFVTTQKDKPVTAVAGGGLVWVERVAQCSADPKIGLRLFTAQGSPAAAFPVQISQQKSGDLAAVLARYSGVAAFEDAIGENVNGAFGSCAKKGAKGATATLTSHSSIADPVHVVGVGLEKKTIAGASAGYAALGSHTQKKARAFAYDVGFPAAKTDVFQATLSGADQWATAGIVLLPTVPNPPLVGGRVYWSDDGPKKIQRAAGDGSGVQDVVLGVGKVKAIAVDPDGNRLYWAEDKPARIRLANLDGTAVADLITGLSKVDSIALDLGAGKIYWLDSKAKRIQRANLDGTGIETIIGGLAKKTKDLAVDTLGAKVYWSTDKPPRIRRANTDGSVIEDIIPLANKASGIAIDSAGGKIYWTDDKAKKILRANLDGTGVEDVVVGIGTAVGLGKAKDLAVDSVDGKIYWIADKQGMIHRTNLDGTNFEDVVSGLVKPRGIAVETHDLSGAGDYFVIAHDGAGIFCLPEPISVAVYELAGGINAGFTGEITLDSQTGTGTWSAAPGNAGTFLDAVPGDGLATYAFDASDGGTASFLLDYRSGASIVDVDVFETANPAERDDDSEGPLSFAPSGFTLTANALPNPPPNPIFDPVGPQTAGAPVPVYLTAYGQTAGDPVCGVIEAYTGSRPLLFWSSYTDPSSGTLAVTVDGVAIATGEAAATTQPVTFNNGQASVTLKYKDVGQIAVSVADTLVAEPAAGIRGGTGPFVVKPASLVVSSVSRSDSSPNPGATTPGGAIFVAAGAPFRATVQVLDAEGSLTPNFGNEASPEGIQLRSAQLLAPAGGRNGTANDGAIGNATGFGATAPAGSFSGSNFSWDEVGAIALRASVADGDYLGAGDVVGPQSGPVGRFTPSRFAVATNAPVFRTGCGLGAFSYLGQPFGFAPGGAPVMTVTAQNAAGGTTANYTGAWWKIDSASLTGRSYTSASGILDPAGLPPEALDPVVVDTGSGSGTLTFSAGAGLRFVRTAPVAPFDAEIALSISVADADGIANPGNPASFGAATPGGGIAFDAGKLVGYGRLVLQNAHDSELQPLSVPLRAEHFDGAVFVANDDDSCTAVALSNLLLAPSPPGLPTSASIANAPLLLGDAGLALSAPGDGNAGWVDIEVDLSAATGANLPWLQYDWPGDGNLDGAPDDNPRGRATFGIYRGRDELIYVREVY